MLRVFVKMTFLSSMAMLLCSCMSPKQEADQIEPEREPVSGLQVELAAQKEILGPVFRGARASSGLVSIGNPGLSFRYSDRGLVVAGSLLPEIETGMEIVPLDFALEGDYALSPSSLSREERARLASRLNAELKLNRLRGESYRFLDEGGRQVRVRMGELEVPSFFARLLSDAADGKTPRVVILPEEFIIDPGLEDAFGAEQISSILDASATSLAEYLSLAGAQLEDRKEIERVLLETDLSVSELFSREVLPNSGLDRAPDYVLTFSYHVIPLSAGRLLIDLTVRLNKLPGGEVEAVYKERYGQ